MEPFQVRLNCVDHYQATPSEFDPPLPYRDGAAGKYDTSKVPVIRIFGATETGQKVCVHVHGAFPYLYIEYDGPLDPDQDHALALNYRRNAYDKKTAFVAHITLVKGVPFYGYHVGYCFFFKIYLLDPVYTTRLADLLLQGAVLKRPLQPYESHLQYVPQWMCDYNLYGCAYMKCSKVKFRSPIPEYFELSNLSHRWHDRSIQPDCVSDATLLPKQSHCPLEADVCVHDILNRVDIKERPLHEDFTEMLKPIAQNERLVPSMAGLWQDEIRRRKQRMGLVDPDSSPFGPEELMSFSADPRNHSEGGWIHEDEFRQLMSQIVAEERKQNSEDMTLDKVLRNEPLEKKIKTALESVEDFFPDKIELTQMEMRQSLIAVDGDGEAQVNENAALSAEADIALYSSEDYYISNPLSDDHGAAEEVVDGVDDGAGHGIFDMTFKSFGPHSAAADDIVPAESPDLPLNDGKLQENDPNHIHGGNAFHDNAENSRRIPKRSHQEILDSGVPRKKLRFFDGNASHLPDNSLLQQAANIPAVNEGPKAAFNASDSTSSTSTKRVSSQATPPASQDPHSEKSGQNRRLNFPVVKDPNDPMTILRFSQDCSPKAVLEIDNQTVSQPPASAQKTTSGSEPTSQLQPSSSGLEPNNSNTHVSDLAPMIYDAFNISEGVRVCCWRYACPNASEVLATLADHGCPSVIYQKAYYSDDKDVPDRPRDYAGRVSRLEGGSIHYLPDFDPSGRSPAMLGEPASMSRDRYQQEQIDQHLRVSSTSRVWEFAPVPPSRAEVLEWFDKEQSERQTQPKAAKEPDTEPRMKPNVLSQIEGPTQKNDYGFKYSQKGKSASIEHQTQYMSSMSLEVHVNTRGVLLPNPEEDEISCIFWCIQSDDEDMDVNGNLPGVHVGVIAQGSGDGPTSKLSKALRIELEREPTELDLINRLVDIVRYHDPDIITGYEVHNGSWGYLIERARKKYDFDICDELSRVRSQAHGRFGKDADRWGFNHTSSIRVTGRHMINIWRAMRSELNLLQYTMENVVFHLLHRRIPHYSYRDLTAWYQSGKPRNLLKVVEYFVSRVQMNLEILESNELIPRTSEQARLLGIDFFSVFSRGSQFKVESLMFRIAKPENYLLVSPSRKQVGQQNALECLPLVMEPQSDFYTSPLLVLDFQSLYPSIMIAYNYCYSTFLGRARLWRGRNKMGFMDYKRQPRVLELLKDKINIAPNGMMYAKAEVRRSLLARMLAEILETRVMVKTGMKMDKDDKVLQRLLNNRQLALKLIANVTYGYTSASFSGRMPCSEIADSIVQSGRETLEKAIALIHSVERWGAEVVYGDTDSLFVYLKGRTRDEAFDIGQEIAKAVTDINPHPIKLKFEKVYHPCVLLAKKRYVGFKYEHRNQKEPEFDAKGIETVRRDGTPAEQKIEEKALKLLFRTADLSQVKRYFQKQCAKIMQGRVSIQDFCFAKEVRLGTYSERGLLPPGAMISTKKMVEDPRSEPQYGERVPYVVVTGAPGSRLVDRCVAPETLLHDAELELDAEYYINKNIIPPLERIFNLMGANVRQWYEEMPKFQRIRRIEGAASVAGKDARGKTLESYMKSSSCIVCKSKLDDTGIPVCSDCWHQPHISLVSLVSRQQQAEKRVSDLHHICQSCMGVPFGDDVICDSKDCPVFYSRTRHLASWKHTRATLEPIIKLLEDQSESALEW
ncbi:DNA-directed DNA polymerase zeta catalytic subunit REV3 [Aspergillus udagawae]|uniref:DNA polymerase n=1 Tax=Aspergillus udagawae TaxID=91492 RepID=A0A8E0QNM8_9EURO|nr:DNA polymerase zeta [Aspergillus udagawae]GIC86614.1 DNA polymerase zeta [Aspergillus udagawae]